MAGIQNVKKVFHRRIGKTRQAPWKTWLKMWKFPLFTRKFHFVKNFVYLSIFPVQKKFDTGCRIRSGEPYGSAVLREPSVRRMPSYAAALREKMALACGSASCGLTSAGLKWVSQSCPAPAFAARRALS